MKYKAIKGLACVPYMRSVSGGSEFDNDVQKLSKELINKAIAEGRIVEIKEVEKIEIKPISKKRKASKK